MLFALQNYGYSFRHVCGIMGHIFSDMYGIMGSNFLTKMARPRSKLGLFNPPPPHGTAEVRSAVADESANEFYNCNDLCSLAGILYGIQLKS